MAQISLRVDDEVKRSAERTLDSIGLSMSTAINIFLKTVVRENRIPFELSADPFYSKENITNADTIAAIEEVQKLKADPNKKTYGSFAELLGDLDDE